VVREYQGRGAAHETIVPYGDPNLDEDPDVDDPEDPDLNGDPDLDEDPDSEEIPDLDEVPDLEEIPDLDEVPVNEEIPVIGKADGADEGTVRLSRILSLISTALSNE